MKSRKKRLSQIVVALLIVYTIGLPIQNIVLANTNEQAINEAVVTEEIETGADEVETSSSEEAEKPTVESVLEEEKTSEKAATSAITEIAPSEQLMEAIIDSEVESEATNTQVEVEKSTKNGNKIISSDTISNIFPDANLAETIRIELGKGSVNDVVTQAELDTITQVIASSKGIVDISGIENLTNLINLSLFDNKVSNIKPLKNLIKLETLNLNAGLVLYDLSPLSSLTNLTNLFLEANRISDIRPLANLTNLKTLNLNANSISDLSPLEHLVNLTKLDLYYNLISDVSPLSSLTNLTSLQLANNRINDLSSLGTLAKLNIFTAGSQHISLLAVKWSDPLNVTNSIKDLNGDLIAPSSIDNQGSYTNSTITWTGLANSNQKVNYEWSQSITIGNASSTFSGKVTVSVNRSGKYNVNYDVEGMITTESVEVDELLAEPQEPNKPGYTFTGWYDAKTGGNKWDFTMDTMPANEITLYAQFSKTLIPTPTNAYINFYEDSTLKYAIPYVGLDQWDGINGVWTNGLVTATPPANNPNKTGHTFTGWKDEQGDLFDFSTTQLDLNSQNEFNFYAAFEKKEYTVTFVIDGKRETKKVLFEELIEEPMSPEKEGHTFDGWHTSPQTRATQWDFNTMGMPANDLTLHAKFTKLSDSGSGSGSGGSEKPSKPVPPVTPEQPGDKDSTNDFKDETTASDTGSMTVTSQENTEMSSPEASQQSKLAKLGEQNSMTLQGFGLLMVISGIAFFWWKRKNAHL
ncbi:hypothetical protein AF306_13020 [Listeria monocytogenes]|nr:hypothetical protein [Listeria monocytogenes]EAD8590193.1 hypothetical protein [Listeria monocytogenes]EAD8593467.1 hypothetical protein [Listeria monocytogenes]EAD8602132.1 hypothetical protein [Listeria monocytogenes]